MSVLAGPLFALAALLAVAGVAKLAAPDAAARALRTSGLPGSEPAVRALGGAEIIAAAATLVYGGRLLAALVAAAYVGFAAFSWLLVERSGATADCGCFGAEASSAPVSAWHVGLNVAAAGVALGAVAWPTEGVGDVLGGQPLAGIPFLALTVLATWLLYACYTLLADVLAGIDQLRADAEAAT